MRTQAGYDLLQKHHDLHPAVVDIEQQAVEYGIETVVAAARRAAVEEDAPTQAGGEHVLVGLLVTAVFVIGFLFGIVSGLGA